MGSPCLVLSLLLVGFLSPLSCQSDICKAHDGEPGRAGRDGRPGQKGDHGEPGDGGRLSGLTTSKGDSGDPGAPGEPGSIGYMGPEGPLGATGEPGMIGSKGAMADASNQRRPAFSAAFTAIKDNTVLFGKIITNQEKVYDGSSGLFTCRDPGYYYFTFQAVSTGDLCLQIWAKVGTANANRLLSFCDRNSRSLPQVNSGGTVLRLRKDDQVWIQADAKSRKIAEKDVSSVFSGFLLFPEE